MADSLVLVNLISEQVIPAVLPIYHINGLGKLINFITNENFKSSSERIAQFYIKKMREMYDSSDVIFTQHLYVKYNDWHSTYEAMRELYKENSNLLINLTGGTKLMAIWRSLSIMKRSSLLKKY